MDQNEWARVRAAERFLNLEISKEHELQNIVRLAAEICQTKIALINLIDTDTQYSRFKVGSDMVTINRRLAFCNQTIKLEDTMVVNDALEDERFVNNPLVTGDPHIRFYAGAPLTTHDGFNIGALCVIDPEPKELTIDQKQLLEILSNNVINIFEFESSLAVLKEQYLESKNAEIKLRAFFESSLACHLLIDKNLNVVYFNQLLVQFVKRLYGTDIEVGMKVTDFIPPAYLDDFIGNYNRALEGIPIQVERRVHFENEVLWWYIAYESARDLEGNITGVSFNTIDVTNRIEQEQKIAEQSDTLKAIAQIQSHEIRGPVASILGLMNFLKSQDYVFTPEIADMMETAIHELDEKIHQIVKQTVVD